MKNLKEILIHNNWLTRQEADIVFTSNVIECINKCERPKKNEIFNAFDGLKPEEVKVLIIGQDPYPDKKGNKIAHGLAFSSKSGYCPSSLKKIFDEIEKEFGRCDFNKSYDLTCWKEQGVLLLNAALTYSQEQSLNERLKLWQPFVSQVILKLLNRKKPLVVMLWGKKAQKLFKGEKNDDNLLILKSYHPQARLTDNDERAFINCKHFGECNEFLKSKKCKPIEWWKTY